MSLRLFVKRRLPRLHERLVPLFWQGVRPAMLPVLEQQLSRSYARLARDPRWSAAAAAVGTRISTRLAPRDRYAGIQRSVADHYAKTGYSALSAILQVLQQAQAPAPRRILDLPCGHGRVLRMLRAAWPEAEITACDLEAHMVDFCAQTFGARGVYAKDSPAQIELDAAFDLIWCGSLLTHLDAPRWSEFLGFFRAHLAPGGVLVFTSHGEGAAEGTATGTTDYGLARGDLERMQRDYAETGFGFAHYPGSSAYYGISLSQKGWVEKQIQAVPGLESVAHLPHEWDDHQDVFGCRRAPTA